MKVKVESAIYDSKNHPIMLILEDYDKELISNMGSQTKYCSYPEDYEIEKIIEFMI